jgi:hypothetical protein
MENKNKILLYVGGGILAYFAVIRPLTDKLGITTSAAAAANNAAGVTGTAWQPNFWQQFGGPPITDDLAAQLSAAIQGAFTLFQDNFDSVLGAIKTLNTKSQVSYLSYYFFNKYNQDLYTFLQNGGGILPWDGLSNSQLSTVNQYVNSLPNS